jgi:hypothetical protein
MPRIARPVKLERVEHILGSGSGTLDFAVDGEPDYLTWDGGEDAEWEITDVERIENAEEDRFILYPQGNYFTCKIEADSEEHNAGPVHCWCE